MNLVKSFIAFTNRYIKENTLKYCIIISIVFIISGLLLFFCVRMVPKEEVIMIYEIINRMFDSKDVVYDDGTLSFLGILLNNIRAGFLISTFGFIPFLFLPLIYVALNGGILGITMGIVDVVSNENVIVSFIKYILPHGIFEIPALILEGVIGTKICMVICKKIFGKEKQHSFGYHIKGCMGIYVIYAIPLTLIAAFIEAVVLDFLYL